MRFYKPMSKKNNMKEFTPLQISIEENQQERKHKVGSEKLAMTAVWKMRKIRVC